MLDWHHANGKNQSKTAQHFNLIYPNLKIKQPLISTWIKDEEKWRKEWVKTSMGPRHVAKQICQTQHPIVTEMMDLWVSKAMEDKILLTGKVLWQKWSKFADLVGIPEDAQLNLSDGWLSCFKVQNGLKEVKRHRKAASVDPNAAERERVRIQELLSKCGYRLWDIFNMDVTAKLGIPRGRIISVTK